MEIKIISFLCWKQWNEAPSSQPGSENNTTNEQSPSLNTYFKQDMQLP